MSIEQHLLTCIFNIFLDGSSVTNNEKSFLQKIKSEFNISADDFNRNHSLSKNVSVASLDLSNDKNMEMLFYMIAAAGVREDVSETNIRLINQVAAKSGISGVKIEDFAGLIIPSFSVRQIVKSIESVFNEKYNIRRAARERSYIATQVTKEGIDELQSLAMCYALKLNVALDGQPGVGKTQSVIEITEIFNLRLFTKTCSSRTSESHIISYPVLTEKNGVSVTQHANGPLALAMTTAGVFYGDEYNLLKEDVQKRMNSSFNERRYIDRNDGEIIYARDGFFAIISYNPSRDVSVRDLEDSVADRFVHFNYREWPGDLKAYISMKKSKPDVRFDFKDYKIELENRGISRDLSFFIFDSDAGKWCDFFTGNQTDVKPEFVYKAHKIKNLNARDKESRKALDELSNKSYSEVELSRMFAKFAELINELSESGRSSLLKKIGLDKLNSTEDSELLQIHRSSTRIISAALKHYHFLLGRGFNTYLAQSYATSIIINQMCYGSHRNAKLKDMTNFDMTVSIAKALGLYADSKTFNTSFIKESLL